MSKQRKYNIAVYLNRNFSIFEIEYGFFNRMDESNLPTKMWLFIFGKRFRII